MAAVSACADAIRAWLGPAVGEATGIDERQNAYVDASDYATRVKGIETAVSGSGLTHDLQWEVVALLCGSSVSGVHVNIDDAGDNQSDTPDRSYAYWLDTASLAKSVSPEQQRLLVQALVTISSQRKGESCPKKLLHVDQWKWLSERVIPLAANNSRRRTQILCCKLVNNMWRDAADLSARDKSAKNLLNVLIGISRDSTPVTKAEDWEVLACLATNLFHAMSPLDENMRRQVLCSLLPGLLLPNYPSAVKNAITRLYGAGKHDPYSPMDLNGILSDLCQCLDMNEGVVLLSSSDRVNIMLNGVRFICDAILRNKNGKQIRFGIPIGDENKNGETIEKAGVSNGEHDHVVRQYLGDGREEDANFGIGRICLVSFASWLTRLILLHTTQQRGNLFLSFPNRSYGWQTSFHSACISVFKLVLDRNHVFGANLITEWVCSYLTCEEMGKDHAAKMLASGMIMRILLNWLSAGNENNRIKQALLGALLPIHEKVLFAAEAIARVDQAPCKVSNSTWMFILENILQGENANVVWANEFCSQQNSIDGVRVLLYCALASKHTSPIATEGILFQLQKSVPITSSYGQSKGLGQRIITLGESVSYWCPRFRRQVSNSRRVGGMTSTRPVDPMGASQFKERPSLTQQVEWCILGLRRPYYDTQNLGWLLPLVIPMIDDYEASWQLRGLSLLNHLLSETVPTAFRYHEGIIYRVLQQALSSPHDGVACAIVQCITKCVLMSERHGRKETNIRLHEVLSTLIDTTRTAKGLRRKELLEGMCPLIELTGAQFVRHLPRIFSYLLGSISEGSLSFGEANEIDLSLSDDCDLLLKKVNGGLSTATPAFRAILTIIVACWPRMRHHQAKIMACVCRAVMVSRAALYDSAHTLALLSITSSWCSSGQNTDEDANTSLDKCRAWMKERIDFVIKSLGNTDSGKLLKSRLSRLHELTTFLLSQEEPVVVLLEEKNARGTEKVIEWYSK